MVKKVVVFVTILFVSCFYNKNEYKKNRFNTFGFSPYKEKLYFNDSSAIFEGYYKLEKPINFDKNHEYAGLRKNYLVFYNNGRVARFLDYDEENFDFNPKKAEMGYYGKKDKKNFIKFKVFFQGVGEIIEEEILFISKDSVITFTHTSNYNKIDGFKSKYSKIKKPLIINKTDW
jgi:hypothetical protein